MDAKRSRAPDPERWELPTAELGRFSGRSSQGSRYHPDPPSDVRGGARGCSVSDRWAIYIDVEGSSKVYATHETRFFACVDALLNGIARIGTQACPESPDRLFVHQIGGDGFVIVSEFVRRSPEMPIAIAVVLMQMVLAAGGVAKSGISQGDFGDVQNCLPTLQDYPPDEHGRRRLGRGILTVLTTMGTALINSHRLATRWPRGARLAVDRTMLGQIPVGVVVTHADADLLVVDWVHTRLPEIDEIVSKTRLPLPSPGELRQKLTAYVAKIGNAVDEDWKHYTLCLNGCG